MGAIPAAAATPDEGENLVVDGGVFFYFIFLYCVNVTRYPPPVRVCKQVEPQGPMDRKAKVQTHVSHGIHGRVSKVLSFRGNDASHMGCEAPSILYNYTVD